MVDESSQRHDTLMLSIKHFLVWDQRGVIKGPGVAVLSNKF